MRHIIRADGTTLTPNRGPEGTPPAPQERGADSAIAIFHRRRSRWLEVRRWLSLGGFSACPGPPTRAGR
jgi:hypothetical protein